MSTRIDARFTALKKEGRAAFVTFLMAGDPDPVTSLAIIKALPESGADIIEIGPIPWRMVRRSRRQGCAR